MDCSILFASFLFIVPFIVLFLLALFQSTSISACFVRYCFAELLVICGSLMLLIPFLLFRSSIADSAVVVTFIRSLRTRFTVCLESALLFAACFRSAHLLFLTLLFVALLFAAFFSPSLASPRFLW